MNMTKGRLREIIREELAGFPLAEEGEGGEVATDEPMEKDAEKLQQKLDTGAFDNVFAKISNVKEFNDALVVFLNKADEHPSIKPNHIRRVLIDLAKELAADASDE
jgi:hypothetical protein